MTLSLLSIPDSDELTIQSSNESEWIHISKKTKIKSEPCKPSPTSSEEECCIVSYKQFILIISENKYIYQYNTNRNTWTKLTNFPTDYKPEFIAAAVDELNDKLYIISSEEDDYLQLPICATFDLLRNKWMPINRDGWHKYDICVPFKTPLSVQCTSPRSPSPMISSPKTTTSSSTNLHILDTGNTSHIVYDIEKLSFFRIHDNLTMVAEYSNLIFLPSLQQLFVIGNSDDDGIYFCDIPENADNHKIQTYEWKPFPVSLPRASKYINSLLIFDHVIMLWSNANNDRDACIWFLDVLHEKLIRSEIGLHVFDDDDVDYEFIKTFKYNVHVFGDHYHSKFSLFDIIPTELYNLYNKQTEFLVSGFIAEMNEKNSFSLRIPYDVIRIIGAFFPLLFDFNYYGILNICN